MSHPAPVLAPVKTPPARAFRGELTDPDRWAVWQPRAGDILVCTPPKAGTTWSQTILTMLARGTTDLPDKVPVLSPWVDADLGVSAEDVAAALDRQEGRRVVKTHTPATGFPVWEGVRVIAVYRHPLDILFSVRKAVANRISASPDHPMKLPLEASARVFLESPARFDDFDTDTLALIVAHYLETVQSGRVPGLGLFHYADMLRDGRGTVRRMAEAAGIDASEALIDAVTAATEFGAMKQKAADYAPVGGTGFWHSDAAFFASGTSDKWAGQLSEELLALYDRRKAELLPDPEQRRWLEVGSGG
ncbi:MAG: sulfotransferase domain-containing protein [Pseudooceanicola atlanticus]